MNKCPLCFSKSFYELKKVVDDRHNNKDFFTIVQCAECKHVYTLVDFNDDDIKNLYESHYSSDDKKTKATSLYQIIRNFIYNSKFFSLWLKFDGDQYFLEKVKDNKRYKLLDYGCFEGRQMPLFAACGYEVEGYEINEKASEVARNKGLIVHGGDLKEFVEKKSGYYDVIILSHVIEHLKNPKETIYNISKLLKESGEIKVSCPNYYSYYRLLFGEYWSNYHVPFHLHHFNHLNLEKLFDNLSLKIKTIDTISPSHALSYSILNFLGIREKKNIIVILFMFIVLIIFKIPSILLNLILKGDCLKIVLVKDKK